MPIILSCLPDPIDIVVQGEQTVIVAAISTAPLALMPVIQGGQSLTDLVGFPVPRAMIGQHDWYGALPRQIGPMVYGSTGDVVMLTIGTPIYANPTIDPIQRWLESALPTDLTGQWFDLSADILGAFEAVTDMLSMAVGPLNPLTMPIPNPAIVASGLVKNITAPVIPPSFGGHFMENFVDSTQKFLLSGVTRNSSGVAIGGCRVVVLETGKIVANNDPYANPYAGETTSDGSGNFSIQVSDQGPYQMIAYLPGSPDIAGITLNSLTPAMG